MRQFLAALSNSEATLAGALAGALLLSSFAMDEAFSDSLLPAASEATTPTAATCGIVDVAVDQPEETPVIEVPCTTSETTSLQAAQARAYLVETARPGYTMTRQGPELAIGRLHPEFAIRLANAVREARDGGLPMAGIFSAYRPPAFGVGGFSDKFNSLHTYGLAVDMHGIGRPGSPEATRWHEVAAKHGVVCPYGARNRAEWNHCQPTSLKIVLADNPLRETVTAHGPLSLESMFEAGDSVLAIEESAAGPIAERASHPPALQDRAARIMPRPAPLTRAKRSLRPAVARTVTKSARHGGRKIDPRLELVKPKAIMVEERPRQRKS